LEVNAMESFISGMQVVWYLLTVGSLAFLAWDLLTNTPAMWVMKLAWVLIVLYTGPLGLFVYLLACRQQMPGTHEQFIAAHWKQAVGSLMHCVAGDATGIIVAAAVVAPLHLSNGTELLIEYVAAFVVGLLIFQALFMNTMLGGDYFTAVRKTFFAEFVSMNMVMVGMIPTMVILMHQFPGSRDPTGLLFWSVMALATMAGAVTAYPINSWMVRRGLKHGMMTASSAGGLRPGAEEMAYGQAHAEHGSAHAQGMPSGGGRGHAHQAAALPLRRAVGVSLLTLLLLAGTVWVTARVVPLTFAWIGRTDAVAEARHP
jgi:hypothetical protein